MGRRTAGDVGTGGDRDHDPRRFADRVDTTHQITNPRIAIDGDTARLTALAEAQHLLTADHTTFALLKNPYDVELIRDGDRWVIRRLRIDNTWFTGDPTTIFV